MTFALQNFSLILKHAAAWLAFILYELTALYFFSGQWGAIGNGLMFYGLHIALFYFHAMVVLPFAFGRIKQPYLTCLILVLLEITVYSGIKYLLDYYVGSFRLSLNDPAKINRYVFLTVWRGLYFMGFATAYWLTKRLLVTAREKAIFEKELAEARYAHLQQQISPHFLFNILNFVYNTVYKYSPAASKAIQQLSEMMRYSLKESDESGKTILCDEVEHICNFIAINRLRYDFELFIDFEAPEVISELKIIPLVLLTFTENVFKHGNLKDKKNPARILLSVNEQHLLRFTTWNLKKPQSMQRRVKSLGVQNAVKRMEYTYGKRYDLKITDGTDTYFLELKIQL